MILWNNAEYQSFIQIVHHNAADKLHPGRETNYFCHVDLLDIKANLPQCLILDDTLRSVNNGRSAKKSTIDRWTTEYF